MPTIPAASIIDPKSQWQIIIKDLVYPPARFHDNKNKLNYQQVSTSCSFSGCANTFLRTRTSGLCDTHQKHQHSLFLELQNPQHNIINAPTHTDIVDKLIDWAGTRNFNLTPLFQDISFNILGNIPDVSTLSLDTPIQGFTPPTLQNVVNEITLLINKHLPDFNNSSYQPLLTNKGLIPARILALTFAGLVLVEEANRGDRWFNRIIRKDESKTSLLGGAMPIGYFAAKMFPWGIELGKASKLLVPNGKP